jgi:uncharacterized membrane protein
VFTIVFTIAGRSADNDYPSNHVILCLLVTATTAFISALALGKTGNFLKWLYPIMVAVFAYCFSLKVLYSNQVYSYLHHNHGVNNFHLAVSWTFFYLLTVITLLGLLIGVCIKMFVKKVNTVK